MRHLRLRQVHPDKRKGLVYLYQSNDMLMHFCWKERSSSTPEDDLVIFPDEIEFKKVTQNTTGSKEKDLCGRMAFQLLDAYFCRTCFHPQMAKCGT